VARACGWPRQPAPAARRRADQAGTAGQASFRRGTFTDTGLPGGSAQVTDHRPLLDQAGFDVFSYEETRAWRRAGR
jgi:hypothetical protein